MLRWGGWLPGLAREESVRKATTWDWFKNATELSSGLSYVHDI